MHRSLFNQITTEADGDVIIGFRQLVSDKIKLLPDNGARRKRYCSSYYQLETIHI